MNLTEKQKKHIRRWLVSFARSYQERLQKFEILEANDDLLEASESIFKIIARPEMVEQWD